MNEKYTGKSAYPKSKRKSILIISVSTVAAVLAASILYYSYMWKPSSQSNVPDALKPLIIDTQIPSAPTRIDNLKYYDNFSYEGRNCALLSYYINQHINSNSDYGAYVKFYIFKNEPDAKYVFSGCVQSYKQKSASNQFKNALYYDNPFHTTDNGSSDQESMFLNKNGMYEEMLTAVRCKSVVLVVESKQLSRYRLVPSRIYEMVHALNAVNCMSVFEADKAGTSSD